MHTHSVFGAQFLSSLCVTTVIKCFGYPIKLCLHFRVSSTMYYIHSFNSATLALSSDKCDEPHFAFNPAALANVNN